MCFSYLTQSALFQLSAAYQLNPYTLWVIAHHAVFKEAVSRTALLCDKEVLPLVPAQTLEDALVFYEGGRQAILFLFCSRIEQLMNIFQ